MSDEPTNVIMMADAIPEAPLRHCPRGDVVRALGQSGLLVYLATPFTLRATGEDGAFSWFWASEALHDARVWSGWLASNGITAVSPVVASMGILMGLREHGGKRTCHGTDGPETLCCDPVDPLDDRFWHAWCAPLLGRCEAMVVPPIRGRAESAGVAFEIGEAGRRRIPVYVIEPEARG